MNSPDLRMRLKEALDNLWSRITSRFSTVDERVDDIDDAIDSVESSLDGVTSRVSGVEGRMTTAEGAISTVSGRVDTLEDAVDDIEGDMIKSISLNGTSVPKDAQGNVALRESDPTVPAWAKQQKAKTSDFTNDGDGTDNNSPFATEAYVEDNGGKIDEVQVNGTPLPIVNKAVDVPVPTKTSDLVNDSGFSNMETLHMTSAAWSSVDYIFSRLSEELFSYEIRPFIASNATISVITNQQISPSLWGFVYTWRNAWDCYRFAGVDNVNGDIYIIEVHTDETHYEQNIVYVDEIYKIDGGGGGGGGGGGSINGIYFNGTLIGIDTEGYVHLDESDPNVQTWAKAQNPPTYTAADVGAIPTTAMGAASGIAELDASGHVPTSQLPSYVDDVLEYANTSAFPATGEAGKIYVAKDTNLTYRWTGSAYTEISPSLALGETSSTAYRGDRGKAAYDHAQAKGSAYASGLYLIQTNSEGHVIAATPVAKSDITALGIPSGVKGDAESSYRTGNVNLTPANIGAAVSATLTNQDLNAVTAPGFYNAGGGNTCANKPSGVDSFGMVVVHSAAGSYYTQTVYTSGGTVWRRINSNGTWSNWQEEIGLVDLVTDFDDFIPDNAVNVHWKYLRTANGNASNTPITGDNITFYGWVMGAPNYCMQCVYVVYADTASNRGRQFVRCRVNGAWQSWIEVMTSNTAIPVDNLPVVNNLTTTVAGSVLDARMGNALRNREFVYAGYQGGASTTTYTITLNNQQSLSTTGAALLLVLKHYGANNTHVFDIVAVANNNGNIAAYTVVKNSTASIQSVSLSGSTLTLTFDRAIYLGISVMTLT